MCDFVFVIHAKRIERQVLVNQQTAVLIRSLGGKATAPDVDEAIAVFEAALAAEPKRRSREQLILLDALLGVGNGRR